MLSDDDITHNWAKSQVEIKRLKAEIDRLEAANADLRRWKAMDKPLTAAMGVVAADTQQLRAEVERLRAMLTAKTLGYELLASTLEKRDIEIEQLRAALEPFAEVARWARHNHHDLADFDMILRGPGKEIAGHLQVQSPDFIRASETLGDDRRALEQKE